MHDPFDPPAFEDVLADLKTLRRGGLTKLRQLQLPALDQAAVAAGERLISETSDPSAIRRLLIAAVGRLGGGRFEDAATTLFGLGEGQLGVLPGELRKTAVQQWGVSPTTFRGHEARVMAQLAEEILGLTKEFALHLSRLNVERVAPAETRFKVEWLRRFDTYYRMWSPVSGLANDLAAARATLLETDSIWADQQDQADGYLRYALFHLAAFLTEKQRFVREFGGNWLLSKRDIGVLAADSIYAIDWESPFSEDDNSYLRMSHADAEGEGLRFKISLDSHIGHELMRDWRRWFESCRCTDLEAPASDCSPYRLIGACNLYQRIIDDEWERLSDWYHFDPNARPYIEPTERYERFYGQGQPRPPWIHEDP